MQCTAVKSNATAQRDVLWQQSLSVCGDVSMSGNFGAMRTIWKHFGSEEVLFLTERAKIKMLNKNFLFILIEFLEDPGDT